MTPTPRPTPAPTPRPDLPLAYRRAPYADGIDVFLDGNEGPGALPARLADEQQALIDAERLRRYPDEAPLARALAERFALPPDGVLLGAGADELLDRLCRAYLCAGRTAVLPVPGFPMLPRYVRLAGATLETVPWQRGAFPSQRTAELAKEAALVFVTTPQNPTGLAIPSADVLALAAGAPGALFVLDLAYAEFADEDCTADALRLPNVVVVRTFSKAYGLAGLRVGYALGAPGLLAPVRACGSPFPVAGPSLQLALAALARGPDRDALDRVQRERRRLADLLAARDCAPLPSQANFVLADAGTPPRARALAAALQDAGIAVRTFDDDLLRSSVRITCPGDDALFARLSAVLQEVTP